MPNTLHTKDYELQLAEKTDRLKAMMAPFNAPEPEIFSSPTSHYRMRAEFRVWHDNDDLFHIMFDKETKERIRVDQFPVASQLINDMMAELLPLIKQNELLRHKLFQIDYLSTLSNKLIVSLLYHKKLGDEWTAEAKSLKATLVEKGFDLQLIGRASKTKIMLDNDYVDEVLPVNGKDMVYRQVENSFTQPNAQVNIKMLEWAIAATQNSTGDLLELYCGNGNFSLALAQNFERVLATEIAKPSVAAAQYNIEANNINNVQIIRMSAEDFTQAMQGAREFRRLEGITLTDYQCNTIFVDPPRSGLDDKTVELVQGYDHILYISCNPETLCDNLVELTKTHKIEKLALFDQFPYTHHMESGVLLTRR
ncbi:MULTISPECIES: tRNA (uridine(54)-C5)-methyltransferase TrmA [Providencia]|uniref:tRNA (uridine(54)-C5)-methyltransferase TrmA n=1 Tax=Providencia TaxID=586 RepID=UPI001981E4AE|nr:MULTISPECIES: tRNA (uridine(54)-C5)-methyltransferase TrmA [Providencia]HEC8330519.1 tRNA (uridine(54)-C5)-methyltransferase TrmA [Providencia rettgeri]MBN4866596.1 tRNA (uridine(54)-C5)-methyltransferase TrmA [Providencia stuartii]MBN4875918.1 tRNA (uridine(54)-C5)-methyltransferase TrmA [Providencia stuartii]MBN4880610.1 tRNA (uridine(54)-C5)-methyltransferase TrmA [Providencia stuartii]MBN4885118.1 tRNA (uridine(54)-C5)-methyltransferase TrmA [Providencia stuartii]